MDEDVVVRVENLWKRYGTTVGAELKRLLSFRRNSQSAPVEEHGPWALRDINFEVRRGETLGVIGRNGAGKSTLLKVLAGVTLPTYGNIEMRGRIFPMIELNAGMHMDLTGRQNAHLLGAVMGFSQKEIQARMPAIEEFCELGDYFDRPVWTYSSGMLARLGFAVAVNVDADILLIDEVLAIGDLAFQRKCYAQIERLRRSDVTVVLVSHSIKQVERLAARTVWLDKGKTIAIDNTRTVCDAYYQEAVKENSSSEKRPPSWSGTGEVVITKVAFIDENDQEVQSVLTWNYLKMRVEFEASEQLTSPIIGINIYSPDMTLVSAFTTETLEKSVSLVGHGFFECVIPRVPFLAGSYSVGIRVKEKNNRPIYTGDYLAMLVVDYSKDFRTSFGYVHTDVLWCFNDA